MPSNYDLYQQQLNEDRARQEELNTGQESSAKKAPASVPFPFGILAIAIIFDLIGLIPIVNIFSEIFAGLTFWFWQKSYMPKIDPLISIVATKIVDFIALGVLPSSVATVIYAYAKKKTASKASTLVGAKIINKLAT